MAASLEAVLDRELQSINPETLEPVGSVVRTPPERVGELVVAAAAAQERWARATFAARARFLRTVGQVVLDRSDEIAATISAETGKPRLESITTEVLVALDEARWLAGSLERILRPERLRLSQLHLRHKRGWLVYEPIGVVGVISPWNLPFAIPFCQVATAVAAGNGVVLKPSELTPLAGEWVGRVFEEAGAPEGLVQVAQGEGETGAALVRARGVEKIVFTGSADVGRRVAAAAGERLCSVTLELGGKDAMLVFADASLSRAVEGAAWGAFLNCGQACVSVERIYVERPRYEEFVQALATRARSLRLGSDGDIGPLISEAQLAKVESLVTEAVADGADAVTGGRRAAKSPGYFYEPTVLTGLFSGSRLGQEEIFGPVVTVEAFDGEDEAVALANGTTFGLAASVWTRDLERAQRVSGRLQAGMVWVNDFGYSFGVPQASWGGYKESGVGRTRSKHGLYDCSQIKYADSDRGRRPVPWWFPYDDQLADGFRGVLHVLHGRGVADRARAAWRYRGGLGRVGRRYLGR